MSHETGPRQKTRVSSSEKPASKSAIRRIFSFIKKGFIKLWEGFKNLFKLKSPVPTKEQKLALEKKHREIEGKTEQQRAQMEAETEAILAAAQAKREAVQKASLSRIKAQEASSKANTLPPENSSAPPQVANPAPLPTQATEGIAHIEINKLEIPSPIRSPQVAQWLINTKENNMKIQSSIKYKEAFLSSDILEQNKKIMQEILEGKIVSDKDREIAQNVLFNSLHEVLTHPKYNLTQEDDLYSHMKKTELLKQHTKLNNAFGSLRMAFSRHRLSTPKELAEHKDKYKQKIHQEISKLHHMIEAIKKFDLSKKPTEEVIISLIEIDMQTPEAKKMESERLKKWIETKTKKAKELCKLPSSDFLTPSELKALSDQVKKIEAATLDDASLQAGVSQLETDCDNISKMLLALEPLLKQLAAPLIRETTAMGIYYRGAQFLGEIANASPDEITFNQYGPSFGSCDEDTRSKVLILSMMLKVCQQKVEQSNRQYKRVDDTAEYNLRQKIKKLIVTCYLLLDFSEATTNLRIQVQLLDRLSIMRGKDDVTELAISMLTNETMQKVQVEYEYSKGFSTPKPGKF